MTTYMNHIYPRTNGDQSYRAAYAHKQCIHLIDAGLYSEQGAQEIIAHIQSHLSVKQLVLGHNDLGDSGCRTLFQFLRSEAGRRYEVCDINLNSNHMSDSGLVAVAMYLKDNKSLRELFLQNNEFSGDPMTARILADAVNASQLEMLSLTSNQLMSDRFIEAFLPALTSNQLRELHLSAMNITRLSFPHIKEYLSSMRCKLNVFKCNGNLLGWSGVRSIVEAVRDNNYSLTTLELHSNHLLDETTDETGANQQISGDAWKECLQSIELVVTRNELLCRDTRRQALQLLRYARAILLHPKSICVEPKQFPETAPNAANVKQSSLSFGDLPLEVQLYILSFISPILSARQLSNIFDYAATLSTLPSLLPQQLTGSTTSWRGAMYHGYSSGRRAGQILNSVGSRDGEGLFLTAVGCTTYELS